MWKHCLMHWKKIWIIWYASYLRQLGHVTLFWHCHKIGLLIHIITQRNVICRGHEMWSHGFKIWCWGKDIFSSWPWLLDNIYLYGHGLNAYINLHDHRNLGLRFKLILKGHFAKWKFCHYSISLSRFNLVRLSFIFGIQINIFLMKSESFLSLHAWTTCATTLTLQKVHKEFVKLTYMNLTVYSKFSEETHFIWWRDWI